MNNVYRHIGPLWLGFSLSAFGKISFMTWQFYAIVIPFFILLRITKFNKDEE
jgi:hypothetical protein